MKFLALLSLAVLLVGCDQVKWRVGAGAPEPPERANHIPFDTVATVTIMGPRDRVERIIHFTIERDPYVLTAVEIRTVE
jgi:hypothetical protein